MVYLSFIYAYAIISLNDLMFSWMCILVAKTCLIIFYSEMFSKISITTAFEPFQKTIRFNIKFMGFRLKTNEKTFFLMFLRLEIGLKSSVLK